MSFYTLAVLFTVFLCVLSLPVAVVNNEERDEKNENSPRVQEDITWPGFSNLKQVSAVSVDRDGNLHVFHRADRVWDAYTFDANHRLTNTSQGPIPNDTILVVDTSNGKPLRSWGANKFYMPHGLTVDRFGNTWVTDVGLHQVFRFPAGETNPDLTLGEPFVPGSGRNQMCKPTDVAVMPYGRFFVSDGYCNSRVLMFSRGGRFLMEIGSKDGMHVPHSLALVPEFDAVCVADRGNGRVLCYATGRGGSVPGTSLFNFENGGLGQLFAVDKRGEQLFLVNGPDLSQPTKSNSTYEGLVLDIESGMPKTLWGPDKGFHIPHDLAVSPDGKYVYVSEIDLSTRKRVYKFNILD